MSISISIVEDNPGTRENLAALLREDPRLRLLGVHATVGSALEGIPSEKPDVALVDIKFAGGGASGIDCVAQLTVQMPKLRVLMLTTYADSGLIFDSLRAGASGYLLKNTPPGELVQAIE